ncbi:MAG: hydrogenase maturation protease [Bryobacteraceae bacterium]
MNEWEWQLLEDKVSAESIEIAGHEVRKGDRVVLRPREGGDIFDLALAGQRATIEAIEQDYEGELHIAVVLEDDPGKDLGMLRQPGHRFFFKPEEIEPCEPALQSSERTTEHARILVAGIGNIFLGDDGFGVELARRLAAEDFPESVRIRDFGIRGYDLTYALLEPYQLIILIDACPRGQKPGTVYVIDPELKEAAESSAPVALDGHTMNPVNVIRLASALGTISARIILVGCEPATFGGEQGQLGLSEPVSAAIDEAVKLVSRIIKTAICGEELEASHGI